MAGSIKKIGDNKYQLTVSSGTGVGGKRIRYYKTIEATSDRAVEKQLAIFIGEVEGGKISKDKKITLKAYSKIWIEEYAEKRLATKTVREYKKLLIRVDPALGHIKLANLKPYHLTQFYNMLREDGIRQDGKKGGLSENSICHYHRLLSTILETAIVEADLIVENPAKKIKDPPKPDHKDVTPYDDDEAIALLEALEQPDIKLKYKVLLTLIVFTGFRRSEVLGLEWTDIDFEKFDISVKRGSQYDEEIGMYTSLTKNKTSKRTISIPEEVMQLVKQYRVWQTKQRLLCGDKWHDLNRLFTQWDGKPMHPSTLNHWMSKFLTKNKLKPISPHGLRHTYASILIDQNIDIVAISEQLGHASKTTTLNLYAHKLKKKNKITSDAMEKTLLKKPVKNGSSEA